MYNARVVAIYNPPDPERGQPANVCLSWGDTRINVVHRGSKEQAMRYIERWIAARDSFPGQRRALKRQEAAARAAATRDWLLAIDRSMRW